MHESESLAYERKQRKNHVVIIQKYRKRVLKGWKRKDALAQKAG